MADFKPPILEIDVILSQAYDQFNTELQKVLNAVAPKKTIKQIDKSKKTHGSMNTLGNKGQ